MKRLDTYRDSVWCDPELTPAEKLILLAMSRYMDFDSLGGARPGNATLSRLTSLKSRQIRRLIHGRDDGQGDNHRTAEGLIAKGWLTETHRGGSAKGQRRVASVYRGTIPDRGHGDPSTGVMGTVNRGHGDPPPSKDPRRPSRAARDGGRPGAPEPHLPHTSANGDKPCDLPGVFCDLCWHSWADQRSNDVWPCPQELTA